MLVFPQFVTGASALYPVLKRRQQRTVANLLDNGARDVYADENAARIEWELHARGMTAAEWNSVESLFAQVSGMWQSFTFLDPTGNLLAQSEDLTAGVWTPGALVSVTAAVADPLGTNRASTVVNGSSVDAGIGQTLAVPGNFIYCLSAWVRSAAGTNVTLSAGSSTRTAATTPVWSRAILTSSPGSASVSSVAFGIQIPAAGSLDVFGLQVEEQLAPSDYKITGAGGVYPEARFGSDELLVRAQGTDVYDAIIRIVSRDN